MSLDLPPDVIGHMASLEDTNRPLKVCPSCLRAVIYGLLLHVGIVGGAIDEAMPHIQSKEVQEHLGVATQCARYLLALVVNLAKTDFADACNLIDHMTDEEYRLAIDAFIQARIEHFTDPTTGKVIYEPHEGDEESGSAAVPSP